MSNMKKQFLYITGFLSLSWSFISCNKDLNRFPTNSNTSATQYNTVKGYKEALAKAYGSYSLVSSSGVGNSDINVAGISDARTTAFLRAYFNVHELTTDENIFAW